MKYHWSVDCNVLSKLVAHYFRGATPDKGMYFSVDLKHLINTLCVSLGVVATCLSCLDLLHTGQTYSPTDKQNANTVVRITRVLLPIHFLLAFGEDSFSSYLRFDFLHCFFKKNKKT